MYDLDEDTVRDQARLEMGVSTQIMIGFALVVIFCAMIWLIFRII